MQRLLQILVGWCCLAGIGEAADSVTMADPGPNRADEPVRTQFSLAAATDFLDSASADWGQSRQCFTCHTNYS
jgi:hypothetical protein